MNERVEIKHYSDRYRNFLTVIMASLFIGLAIHPAFIVLIVFGGVGLGIITLWTYKDVTIVETREDQLYIKEVEKAFSTEYNLKMEDIIKIKLSRKNFVHTARVKTNRKKYVPQRRKAYTKNVVMIQTERRVIKVGKYLMDEDVVKIYEVLADWIKSQQPSFRV